MLKLIRKIGLMNSGLIGTILLLWLSVFLIGGLAGVYSWTLVKLVLPFLGLLGIFVNVVLITIFIIKKKKSRKLIINLIINGFFALPLLMTINVIPFAYPNDLDRAQPPISVKWPFNEPTIVGWGGDTVEDNPPHVIWPSERWAYDLVMEPYDINSNNNEDYGIWNKEVHSPVSGTVIAAYDEEADIVPGSEENITMEGNHVYIKINETDTYLLLNHLKKDSVTVETGDTVKPGDVIGRVGNSGSTSEPHLHIQHQRQDPTSVIFPTLAEGLPLFFEDIHSDPMPKKGAIVSSEIIN